MKNEIEVIYIKAPREMCGASSLREMWKLRPNKNSGTHPRTYIRYRTTSFTPRAPKKNNPHESHPGTHNSLPPTRDLDSLFDINYCFPQPLYPSSNTTSKYVSPIYTKYQKTTSTMDIFANVITLSEACTLSLNCNSSKTIDFLS